MSPESPGSDPDASGGYEAVASVYAATRSRTVGAAAVERWAARLRPGARVLDLGCGPGEPVSTVLHGAGCAVHALDASPAMINAYRARFPATPLVCADAAHAPFPDRSFDGVVAWGLLFLLRPEHQQRVVARVAALLKPEGRFLFTAPRTAATWRDVLTGRTSVSLGHAAYRDLLASHSFEVIASDTDEGGNDHLDAVWRG